MRKVIKRTLPCFLFLTALTVLFSSCGMGKLKIQDHEWKMRCIMHAEDSQVVYDAAAEESSTHPEAKIIDMTLAAKDGKITITDVTNNKTYEGTYTVSGKNPKGTDYKVTIDGKEGYATVAMTSYADGKEEPTLPINLAGYSLYFYAK